MNKASKILDKLKNIPSEILFEAYRESIMSYYISPLRKQEKKK